MRSYASIDRIEEHFAVCEVELLEVKDSKSEAYLEKETEMMDILLEKIVDRIGNVNEGNILVVQHDGKNVYDILCKDDEEKQRRIALIQAMMRK